MIDPEDAPAQQEAGVDPPCYAPRGDFLIGLAQEAISLLKGHDDKPTTRRASQLKTRLDKLMDELNSTP